MFKYRAVNFDGKIVTGSIAADNYRRAVRLLQHKRLKVVEVSAQDSGVQQTGTRDKKPGWSNKKATSGELIAAFQQLTVLLESGLPLVETVASLADSAGNFFIAREFGRIAAELRHGQSFSQALEKCQLSFPRYLKTLANAGELTGKMASSMRDGLEQWKSDLEISTQLRNALIYPVILVASGICAVLLIFILVVPKFAKLLDRASGDIPLLAKVVIGSGTFFNHYMMELGIGMAVVFILGFYGIKKQEVRRRVINVIYKLPFLHVWMAETVIGNWAALLATLLANKVPLLTAIDLSSGGVKIDALSAGFSQVIKNVGSGSRLADSLQDMNAITPIGYNLIHSGENSGRLPEMLKVLSTLYMENNQNRIKRFLIILEPVAILCIGCAVGLIMGGIILAITSVNDMSI